MKTLSITKMLSPKLATLALVMIAGMAWSGNAEACSIKAGFIDSVFGKTIYFYNTSTSTSGKNAVYWSFGDTTYSTASSPTHTYHSYNTTYRVCVAVKDTIYGCVDTLCTTITTGRAPCSAIANFLISKGSSGKDSFVDSSSSSSGNYYSEWNFGDNTASKLRSPAHVFSANGVYRVCLTVTDTANSNCSSTYCMFDTVKSASPCYAYYSYSYSASGADVKTNNGSSSKYGFTSIWNWGDGSSGPNTKNPDHTYSQNGTYTACLTISDSIAGCSASYCDTINVGTACTANIYYYAKLLQVAFTDSNSSALAHKHSAVWDFGDGSATVSGDNPTHTYSKSGGYTACVTVYDSSTTCSTKYCRYLYVSNCNLTASFTDSVAGHLVLFYGQTNDTFKPSNTRWDFGDGTYDTSGLYEAHTYASNLTYVVATLIVNDSVTGCEAYVTDTINFTSGCKLTASFRDSIKGHTVKFFGETNASPYAIYTWQFGDGDIDSTSGLNPTHTYANSVSVENVYLKVYDSTTKCLYYYNNYIVICAANSSFTYSVNGLTVSLRSDSDSASAVKYYWDFNDKTYSMLANPSHTYSNSGTYDICLTAIDTNLGCSTTTCQNITVSNCSLSAKFDDSIKGRTVRFSGTTNASSHSSYEWYFGDGTRDSTSGLNVTYTYPGSITTENVYLKVYDSTTKCLTYATQTLTLCAALSDYSYSIKGLAVTLQSDSANASGVTYSWDFNDKSDSKLANPTHTYSTSGIYDICLTVTDSGCSSTTCHAVTVASCSLTASFTDSIDNHKVTFYGKTNASSHSSVLWYFGDGVSDSTSGLNATHTYGSSAGTEVVYMRVYDSTTKCLTYASITINLSYCISGKVMTGKTNGYPAWAYLIEYKSADSSLTAIDSMMTDQYGNYNFCDLGNGTYYTKAALTDSNTYYKDYIPTYHSDATKWGSADSIVISNASDSSENIAMKKGTNPGGAGFIGGKITAGANKTGDPENNILVILYDGNDNPVTYTYSNNAGYYSFPGIAFGTYTVWGEVLSKICYPATVTLSDTQTTDNNVNLSVNLTSVTAAIHPIGYWYTEKAMVFPNPVTDKLNVALNLKNAESVNLKIYDITGKVVKELNTTLGGGAQNMTIDASALPSGLYFMRMEMLKDNTIMEAQFVKARQK